MQHQPEACASDLGDSQSRYLFLKYQNCIYAVFVCKRDLKAQTNHVPLTPLVGLISAAPNVMICWFLGSELKFGRHSFYVAAPVVWNSLLAWVHSSSISRGQSEMGLKTHLFLQACA